MIRFVFGNAPLRSLPEVLCLWADELHDRVCRNIKHLAEQIQRAIGQAEAKSAAGRMPSLALDRLPQRQASRQLVSGDGLHYGLNPGRSTRLAM